MKQTFTEVIGSKKTYSYDEVQTYLYLENTGSEDVDIVAGALSTTVASGGTYSAAASFSQLEVTPDAETTIVVKTFTADMDAENVEVEASIAAVFVEKTPASADATGSKGEFTYDGDYLYVCSATDTWLRVAIATWGE